jgi:hypothetical protein
MTVPEFLEIWRDAIRAAELADRLSAMATDAAASADLEAETAADLAQLAEAAAEAATRAAARARTVATEAAQRAGDMRSGRLADAQTKATEMRQLETDAASAYHDAERKARAADTKV